MRVVLDTNVIVSAVMTAHGPCSRILDMLTEGVFDICIDDRIIDEYDTVLRRPELRIAPEDAAVLLEMIRSVAEPIVALPLSVHLADPGDLPFLEVAVAAEAVLITGNVRHFPGRVRSGVAVVTPREFLELLRRFL